MTIHSPRLHRGWHLLRAQVSDAPGNVGASQWSVFVDNTKPTLAVRSVKAGEEEGPAKRRAVQLVVAAKDAVGVGKMTVTATDQARPRGAALSTRVAQVAPPARSGWCSCSAGWPSGATASGSTLADRAGNLVTQNRRIAVR